MIQIYHNPRCGKSRNCLHLLQQAELEVEIIPYLETGISATGLKSIISKLGIKPDELVRKKEKIWIENYKNKNLNEDEVIEAMVENPILIERPILIQGKNAIIAREEDKIHSFIAEVRGGFN